MEKTYHEGAKNERSAIMAHVRRKLKLSLSGPAHDALLEVQAYILGRKARYEKRAGGL